MDEFFFDFFKKTRSWAGEFGHSGVVGGGEVRRTRVSGISLRMCWAPFYLYGIIVYSKFLGLYLDGEYH